MSELFYVDHALPNMVSLKITEREGKTGEIRRRKAMPFCPLKKSGQKPAFGGHGPAGLGEYG